MIWRLYVLEHIIIVLERTLRISNKKKCSRSEMVYLTASQSFTYNILKIAIQCFDQQNLPFIQIVFHIDIAIKFSVCVGFLLEEKFSFSSESTKAIISS